MPSPGELHRDIFGYRYNQPKEHQKKDTAELVQIGVTSAALLDTSELIKAGNQEVASAEPEQSTLLFPGETIFNVSDERLMALMSCTNSVEFIRRLFLIPDEKIEIKKGSLKITMRLRDLRLYFLKLNIHASCNPEQWARDEKDVLHKVILGEVGVNIFPDHPSRTAKQIDIVRYFINLLRKQASDVLSTRKQSTVDRIAV